MTTPIVWYVHGAHASPRSFAYLKTLLPAHESHSIAYSSDTPAMQTLAEMVDLAEACERPIHVVGHSLGGVLALALSKRVPSVERVVTLSAPFGGSKVASTMRWFIRHQLFDDIHPHSTLMQMVARGPIRAPVLSFVTHGGRSSLMPEPNDGVVTVASQRAVEGPKYIDFDLNHFEVLLSEEIVEPLTSFLF